jgi:trigger factor
MKAELIDVSHCKKKLEIEIPQDAVDHEITHIAQEFARKARVPGFRPGKAPLGVVKTRYREEIVSEMMQHLLPKYFGEAIEDRKLEIVDSPHFENIDYNAGQPLKFRAAFEVYPELSISNYVGIPLQEISNATEDSDVDAALRKLQEDMAELAPVEEDRPVQTGDFVEVSFVGAVLGTDRPPITADKVVVEIGGRTTLQEFTANLTGAKTGEERSFTVSYRANYPEKTLAGQQVEYKVKIETIKQKDLPEINDEFAQRFGEYKTLDDLKEKIREDIEQHKKDHAQEQMREKLLEWLQDNNEFELPESLVERQLQIRVQRLFRDLSRQGINPQHLEVDWGKVRDQRKNTSMSAMKRSNPNSKKLRRRQKDPKRRSRRY